MAATLLLILVVVLVAGGLVFGIITLLSGDDPGLSPVEADGRARPLPNNRSLSEGDLKAVRFDLALRGYRMAQVDRVLRRTAYDVGYKDEMIAVLEAEVTALREGRREDADLLRKAREAAASPSVTAPAGTLIPTAPDEADESGEDATADEVVIDLDADRRSSSTAAQAADEDEALAEASAETETPYDPTIDTSPGRLAPRPLLDGVEPAGDEPGEESGDEPERHD
jgi:DivIVA domain-containing protein